MFQLRSFVHQRLYAAAEEILGEVEKVMTLALYEADVQRLIQEPDSPSPKLNSQRQISEPPLINSDVAEEESLQKISSQPSTQEESYLSKAEVPGPSETTEERCVVQVHFGIKEEQEEHGYYSQTQDVMYPFEEVAKREEDQPETEGFDEMQLVTSDGSEAFSDNRGSDEERVKRKEASMNVNISAQREKERLVCPTCGKGFWYISPFVKHIETHKKKPLLTARTLNGDEELQESSTQEESYLSQVEVPGSSKTPKERCSVHIGLEMNGERAEHGHDRQTQEVSYPSTETEQGQPVNEASAEMQPVSSDGSEAESEIKGSDEEGVQNEGAQKKMRLRSQSDLHVCPTCGKGFRYISPFVKHLKKHKKINGPTRKLLEDLQSPHSRKVCDVCGKKFSTSYCLKIHSKIHAGIRDFECQDCGKTFYQRGNLMMHLKRHSGERPYQCDICGISFTLKHNLTAHRRRHTERDRTVVDPLGNNTNVPV
nr:zinc finger protein 624-like [Labrus bergylta]